MRKNTIEKLKKLAQSRGGKCLSAEYTSSKLKLQWECKEGHRWAALAGNIVNLNNWCPACAGTQKLTIEEMQQIARSRGGKCLSAEYSGQKTKLLWQCAEGHQWEARPANIKNLKQWCPVCRRRRLTIEEMREIARSRGGKCLSAEYVNTGTKLLWQCAEGHRWNAPATSVKYKGTWCPECYRIKQQKK